MPFYNTTIATLLDEPAGNADDLYIVPRPIYRLAGTGTESRYGMGFTANTPGGFARRAIVTVDSHRDGGLW